MRYLAWFLGIGFCIFVALTAGRLVFSKETPVYEKVVFYFSAHPDDWQLFMGASAYRDVADKKAKVVFIHTTAGDAGYGSNRNDRRYPYYAAREEGARSAIRFMVDAHALPQSDHWDMFPKMNGRRIFRVSYGNTQSYFLRLPDGHPSGSGFAGTDFQSLEKLRSGRRSDMVSIDGAARYGDWSDLVRTVYAIILRERGTAKIEVHIAESDQELNPQDHSDHLATAALAREAVRFLCAKTYHHVEYASSSRPPNLSHDDAQNQAALFAVTVSGINRYDIWSSWEPGHRQWLGREYFRIEDSPCHAQN